jgi:hypothetical protein
VMHQDIYLILVNQTQSNRDHTYELQSNDYVIEN